MRACQHQQGEVGRKTWFEVVMVLARVKALSQGLLTCPIVSVLAEVEDHPSLGPVVQEDHQIHDRQMEAEVEVEERGHPVRRFRSLREVVVVGLL